MYSVRLVGGPENGKLYDITDEQWDSGVVLFNVNAQHGKHLSIFPVIKTIAYRRKGRDNAAFEFAGEVSVKPKITTK